MELDSDPLHLGTGAGGTSTGGGAGGRSFTSYSTSRDRLYDKYGLDSRRYEGSSSALAGGAFSSSLIGGGSNSAATTRNLLYRPSTLSGQLDSYNPTKSYTSDLYSSITAATAATTAAVATTSSSAITTTITTATTSLTNPLNRIQSSLAGTTGAGAAPSNNLLQQMFDDMRQIEDTIDSIEIPARGRCKVYMAKYGYDPFKQSPNENPDAELAFNAGDYIMVFDDVDEDGYFIGELIDGRRGFVPSNWLDRLTGEDLFEFQASTLYKQAGTKDDESESNSYPPEFYDAIVSETMNHSNFQHILAPEDYHRMNDYVDLDDVNEIDDEFLSDYERAEAEQMRRAVPPPQRLVLERQLNKSILIGWLHPQAAKGTIVSYQVYVDGVLKSTVPSGDRTKALLEGVDSNIPHRISVRAIDLHGRHSNDAGCTIVIGQKIPFAPSCVKASHITSDSALISWLPCNSNFHHVVAVNSVEVQTVRPGVYKHLINGLSANTLYRVWVRAKPGKILSIDEKNPKKLESLTTYVDFKTMPKSLPDPPVNVQVEAGPQRRTLLVTWLPLTLNDFGVSNGCAVTGYAVFAGHKKLADIDSPTGDHALLDLSDLESLHKKSVTVRTKSGENLSQDSMPCHIPDEYLKAAAVRTDNNQQAIGSFRYHQNQLHQQRLSDSSLAAAGAGRNSPMRHHHQSSRYAPGDHQHHQHSQKQHQLHQQQLVHSSRAAGSSRHSIIRGRQLARSMQNLESDLDSRRSSIPAIEITRETSGSDHNINLNNQTESYSEEEFESSMRFRGMRGKPGSRMNARYRARQSHSVDSSVPHNLNSHQNHIRSYQQLAKLRGAHHQMIDSRDIRYFVALFDYDPSTMSPNPNAASEELAFKEGSIIKIIGDKGPDGFYRGELDNHFGYVPCNVVSEITDQNLLLNLQQQEKQQNNTGFYHRQMIQQLQQQQLAGNLQQQQPQQQQQQQRTNQQQQQQQQVLDGQAQQQTNGIKRMTALYDYDPQENSPNADTESEIPFKVGDVIYVYGKMDTDGFYMGEVERTKQRGLVPSNFLREDPQPMGLKQQPLTANLMNQQQKPAMAFGPNQVGVGGGGVMEAFQQQQQRPPTNAPGQFINQVAGNTVQQQQQQLQQVNATGDPSMSGAPYGPTNAMQLNQPQHLNKINNVQQMQQRGNVRGSLPMQNQPLVMQTQQNISRPTSLSLGVQNANPQLAGANQFTDWNNQRQMMPGTQNQMMQANVQQQQQQQQQQLLLQQGKNPNVVAGGGGMMGNQQHGNMIQGQPQFQQQQPSMINNQQASGGGVLSNLLSSGKQIIGAATTPRAPNPPNQFPSMMVGAGMGGGSMVVDQGATGNYHPMNARAGANLMQQQPHFNNEPGSLQIGHNSFALSGNQIHQPSGQQQQQQQQHQQQQQQHYNQMNTGVSRGPVNQMAGEEQTGNILSTVKNIFKQL